MSIIINLLIIFFIFLIIYQIILAYFSISLIEGMSISPTTTSTNQEYKQYDEEIGNNTFMLAQKNSGNIEYLKQRIDDIQGMYQQIQDLSGNLQTLQTQVTGLVQAQQDYVTQMTGGTAPNVTGLVEEGENFPSSGSFVTE